MKNMEETYMHVATAKSLQSCPTLCHPIDGSPPGSPVPGILQARTLSLSEKSQYEKPTYCMTPRKKQNYEDSIQDRQSSGVRVGLAELNTQITED